MNGDETVLSFSFAERNFFHQNHWLPFNSSLAIEAPFFFFFFNPGQKTKNAEITSSLFVQPSSLY